MAIEDINLGSAPNDGTGDSLRVAGQKINDNFGELNLLNRIIVNQSNVTTTLGGVIDSTKEYFIDGIIDLGATEITVPPTGMTIRGMSFNISGLTTSQSNHTMFGSLDVPTGSGTLLMTDIQIVTTGTGSKVFSLVDSNGLNNIGIERVAFLFCKSLGELIGYSQGIESEVIRQGGTPTLSFQGTWANGYRISSSLVRMLDATMTEPLFKSELLFSMNSRFLIDINCDLPVNAPFCDFESANFPNPSTVQLKGAIFTRNGSFNPNDTNIFTNLNPSDLPCDWTNNIGISNTFVGGSINNTSEVTTTINTQGTAEDLEGTFATSDLQHFDSPSNGRLRHIGINPREFTVSWDFLIDGKDNDNYELFLIKIDSLANVTVELSQVRTVNNFQGGRDVGIWSGQTSVVLNQNDLVFWQVANLLDDDNCVLEIDSSWSVKER